MYEEYTNYLFNKIIETEKLSEELKHYHSLFLRLSSRDYMKNGRSATKEGILDELLNSTEDLDKETIGGAVSSVLIFHQVAEEWLYDLLELARFAVDLKLFPERITHTPSEKLQLNGLAGEIEKLIDFDKKQDVLKYSRLVNQYRNKIAHDLLKQDNIETIKKEVSKFMEHFDSLFESLEGTEKEPYGARESLFEHIKFYHKWSDEFYDKYIYYLQDVLGSLEIPYENEDTFEQDKKA